MGGAEGPHIKDTLENREGEASPIGRDKAIHQQDGQRVNDKQSEERNQYDDGSDHDGIGKDFLRSSAAPCRFVMWLPPFAEKMRGAAEKR